MRTKKYIDLTHNISNKTPVYPGDKPVELSRSATIQKEGYRNSDLELSMHTGTHIDTKGHFFHEACTIDEYDLSRFILEIVVLNVCNKSVILLEDWMKQKIIPKKGVLLYTGHDQYYGKDKYHKSYPIIDHTFAEFLIEQDIPLLGMDTPSPDIQPFLIHQLLLESNMILIENLTNIEALLPYKSLKLFAIPLKLPTYGAPVRVIAEVDKKR